VTPEPSADPAPPAPDPLADSIAEHNARLVRRAVVVLVATAVVTVLVCTVARGLSGFVGSLLGVGIVVLFFGADVLALRLTRRSKPLTIVAVIIFLYFVKLLLVLIGLLLLKGNVAFDGPSLVAAVIIGSLAAGAAAMRLWSTMHVAYVDP
jgi:ATP synthase protein I